MVMLNFPSCDIFIYTGFKGLVNYLVPLNTISLKKDKYDSLIGSNFSKEIYIVCNLAFLAPDHSLDGWTVYRYYS